MFISHASQRRASAHDDPAPIAPRPMRFRRRGLDHPTPPDDPAPAPIDDDLEHEMDLIDWQRQQLGYLGGRSC